VTPSVAAPGVTHPSDATAVHIGVWRRFVTSYCIDLGLLHSTLCADGLHC